MKRTAELDLERSMAVIVGEMKLEAFQGFFDGRVSPRATHYVRRCTRCHSPTRTSLIYTRDTGHHTSGWMKNPQYERCLHLSTSPFAPTITVVGAVRELDRAMSAKWVQAFFGEDARYVWAESPKSSMGIARGVCHWRLFCDEAWSPILPAGEVYSTELTEIGWRSASQVLEQDGVAIQSVLDPT